MKKKLVVFGLNLIAFLIVFIPFRFFILLPIISNTLLISLISLFISLFFSPKFSLFPKTTEEQLLMKLPFIKRPYLFNLFSK